MHTTRCPGASATCASSPAAPAAKHRPSCSSGPPASVTRRVLSSVAGRLAVASEHDGLAHRGDGALLELDDAAALDVRARGDDQRPLVEHEPPARVDGHVEAQHGPRRAGQRERRRDGLDASAAPGADDDPCAVAIARQRSGLGRHERRADDRAALEDPRREPLAAAQLGDRVAGRGALDREHRDR